MAWLACHLVVEGGAQTLAEGDLGMAGKVLDHKASANYTAGANGSPQRNDLWAGWENSRMDQRNR